MMVVDLYTGQSRIRILHRVRRGKPIPSSGSHWERKLWCCGFCSWHPHRRKGCNQENQWCLWACFRCYKDPERNQASPFASSSWHRWNKAHHASSFPTRIPRYLCCLWVDGIWPPPGYQGKWWSYPWALSVFLVPASSGSKIYSFRLVFLTNSFSLCSFDDLIHIFIRSKCIS